jgi:processive 1,2-diacylglycerol beta-glucosyltransferase
MSTQASVAAEGGVTPPRVLLFYVDAGGGHRNVAQALAAAAEERRTTWRFDAVNFQKIVAPLDFTRRITGRSAEDLYNVLLRREWTVTMVPLLRVLQGLIRLRYRALVRHLVRYFGEQPAPAAVLSVFPNFNAVLRDACRSALPGVPFGVLVTDLADFPPHFWIEPGLDYLILGSERAAEQACAVGLRPDVFTRVSGMVLHPRFHVEQDAADVRARLRAEVGFAAEDFVILLLFGGKGSPEIERLASGLLAESPSWRVAVICGDNPALLARMQALRNLHGLRLHVTGFTSRVAEYMHASDLLVTKPGPGSLAEAWHCGLPVVVAGNRDTIPQERFNVRYLIEQDLGVAVERWADAPAAVRALVGNGDRLRRVRENLAHLPPNRAVYEALDVIASHVSRRGAQKLRQSSLAR